MKHIVALGEQGSPGFYLMPGIDSIGPVSPAPAVTGISYAFAFSPDGQYMAHGFSESPYVRVYRTQDWSAFNLSGVSTVYSLDFSPDGQYLAAIGVVSPFLRIFNTSTWSLVSAVGALPAASSSRVRFSPDGQYLAVGLGGSPYLRVYKVSDWSVVSGTPTIPGLVTGLSWSPDSSRLAISHGNGNQLTIVDTSDWSVVSGTPTGVSNRAAEFSPDGSYLALGFITALRVYRVSDWVAVYTSGTLSALNSIRWSPDGEFVVATRGGPGVLAVRRSDWTAFTPNVTLNGGYGIAFGPALPEGPLQATRLMDGVRGFSRDWSGPYDLEGVTKHRVGETDVVTRARVSLMEASRSKRIIASTWSDPETGKFTFRGLDTARRRFITLAEYPANPDNPANENYLRPVAGVSKKPWEGNA